AVQGAEPWGGLPGPCRGERLCARRPSARLGLAAGPLAFLFSLLCVLGCAVKYSGYLEHADEPFCTNCTTKLPRLMKLGEDITLRGLEIGLLTMKKGEVARFVFTPVYAYGQQGCPPLIPPNATVLFEVEMLDFLDSADSDAFFALTAEQQDTFPLQKVLKVADTEREFGNYLYRKQCFEGAKERYKRAYSILGRSPSSVSEQCQIDASKLLVLLNLSVTYLKLEHPDRALMYGEKALEIDHRNAKALFRCGQQSDFSASDLSENLAL
uniref:peptidylprolyl isomerase n=1 Tax=Anas platyrhynchos TaxID=8839 RepID=A0A8B9TMK7_ANAPL